MNAYTNNEDIPEFSTNRKRPRLTSDEGASRSEQFFDVEWIPVDNSKEDEDQAACLNAKVTFLENAPRSYDKLCLIGRAQLKCLQGCIEILGYRLDPTHPKVPVESPPWTSLLVFHPLENDNGEGAVILIESWWPQSAEKHLEPTFDILISSAPGARPTIIPSTWEHAMDTILPQLRLNHCPKEEDSIPDTVTNSRFRIAICGAKSVGKSTLLRYATNRILHDTNNYIRQVAILDADVGQPEMSPPGLMTLTVVSEPFWTPAHYRSMARYPYDQQFGYFFGSVTSKNDPDRYMNLVQRLIQHYEQDVMGENIPLLINLDGWVKGLGYELLTALLTGVLEPTHVLQILGTTKSKQFPLREVLNPERSSVQLRVVYSYDNNLNVTFPPQSHQNGESSLEENGVDKANVAAKVPVSSTIPSSALRDLRLCTYFLDDVTIWYNVRFGQDGIEDNTCEIANRLAAALPYVVPFEAVDILWEGSDHFSDLCPQQSPDSDLVLDALNANIVGLCCGSRNSQDDRSLDETTPYLCIGLGLIRSIDRAKRLFYILTPIESWRLKHVNILVGGTIEMPTEFWFRGVQSEAFPYQTLAPPNSAIGAEPMKSRNNIGRRSLNKK